MSTARKITRQMAKDQMKTDGVQHPCRQYNKPSGVVFSQTRGGGRKSYFSSHWRTAAVKRTAGLQGSKGHRGQKGILSRKSYA